MPPPPTSTPAAAETPEAIEVYKWVGLDLTPSRAKKGEWIADCPHCATGGGKFGVTAAGVHNCFLCGIKGNAVEFMRRVWQESRDATTEDQYEEFAADRQLLSPETLKAWGAAWSVLSSEWILPGYSADGRLITLYRRIHISPDKKHKDWWWRLDVSPRGGEAGGHGLFGVPLLPKKSYSTLYKGEGPWDAMAFWETAQRCTSAGQPTGNPDNSLLANAGVVGVPGVNVFFPAWAPLWPDKTMCLLYDNDHPGKNPKTGREIEPSSLAGLKRATEVLAKAERPPAEVRAIRWGGTPEAWAHDPALKGGYDIRDHLAPAGGSVVKRAKLLHELMAKVEPVPAAWVPGRSEAAGPGGTEIELLPCDTYEQLFVAVTDAYMWPEGHDRALTSILAAVVSTDQGGTDQLFIKLVGPPSSGKTLVCEMLAVNKQYVHSQSHIQSFRSGYNDGTGKDYSLVAKLDGKTLVMKEGDTLLSSPIMALLLSQLRDIYDRVTRHEYATGVGGEYHPNMSFVLAGTPTLYQLNESSLGDRFLTVVMVDRVSEEDERETALRGVSDMTRDIATTANGTPESRDSSKVLRVKQLCGGYINYLRENAGRLFAELTATMTREDRLRFVDLGYFVSFMRTRPSKTTDGRVDKELCYRLCKQFTRFAMSTAVVMNRKTVDAEVMRRTTQTAIDTSNGRPFDIVDYLYTNRHKAVSVNQISAHHATTEHKDRDFLAMLAKLGAVEKYKYRQRLPDLGLNGEVLYAKGAGRDCWRLTESFAALYARITGQDTVEEGE